MITRSIPGTMFDRSRLRVVRSQARDVRKRRMKSCRAGKDGGPMPRAEWSDKREKQYEHIKDGLLERGDSEGLAEEIAARTVNKARARAGESKTASKESINDISSGRRGGLRSHKGAGGRTRDQLYEEARRSNVKGRSSMSKAQLERAVSRSK
jgi:hypothetical protein